MIRRVPLAFSFALVLLPLAAQETAKPQEPAAPAVNTAIVPVPREGAWKERHDKINADVAAHRGDCEGPIFIGTRSRKAGKVPARASGRSAWHHVTR